MSASKKKAVSSGTFFDLKAEIARQEEEFTKNKAAGKTLTTGARKPNKKPTVWARSNKGVQDRVSKDIQLEAISKPTLDSARAALERKAKIYDKLRQGKTGGLNDKQYSALLVDFDQPGGSGYESGSDDVDETVPTAVVGDDPLIEYEDEFGRVRTARRSEVPRNIIQDPIADEEEFDPDVIYNPVGHFPIYEPSAERVAAIAAEHSEQNNPLGVHYDASTEVRAKGAGFYQFSKDEETRKAQMDEMKAAREETARTRDESGALDLKTGVIEGMRAEGEGSARLKSRAMEKRKREIEERRKAIEAKRRKKGTSDEIQSRDSFKFAPHAAIVAGPTVPLDPFVALERQGKAQPSSRVDDNVNSAEDFLAKLSRDLASK